MNSPNDHLVGTENVNLATLVRLGLLAANEGDGHWTSWSILLTQHILILQKGF